MKFATLPAPSAEELRQAYNRTDLNTLGYTFDTAMASPMFSKVLKDIVYASRIKPAKRMQQGQPAPNQLALI